MFTRETDRYETRYLSSISSDPIVWINRLKGDNSSVKDGYIQSGYECIWIKLPYGGMNLVGIFDD